ncbi:WXG100 family type VII secretion target [Nocardia sp. NPDC050712]|uniref:WXG100 family type VII secretion target n=1 Tax=Nocardia sp. NPDC050712 TaxID=3155518 RepID=UPI0033E7C060
MRYQVDLTHLDEVTARITTLHGFLVDSLREVDERIATVQQSWNGEAADKQAQAHQQWVKAAQSVQEGIETMRSAAATARTAYTEASAANLRMLGRGSGA